MISKKGYVGARISYILLIYHRWMDIQITGFYLNHTFVISRQRTTPTEIMNQALYLRASVFR